MTSPSERDHEVADAARMYVLAVRRLDGACGELIAAPPDDPNVERLRDDAHLAEAAHDHLKARLLRAFEEPTF